MKNLGALTEPLLELYEYKNILNCINNKNTPVLATGVVGVQQAHIIGALKKHTNCPALIITYDESRAKDICNDMGFFDENVMYYPTKDIIFYSADVRSNDIVKKRFLILNSLLKGENLTIVLSAEALFDRFLKKEIFESFIINLNEGDILKLDLFIKNIIYMGYERVDKVEGAGQFAVRGGIIDIYSPVEDNAYRIELWDNEIDSIRIMDTLSQRSIERVFSARIFPIRELIYNDEKLEEGIKKIKKEYVKVSNSFDKKGLYEEKERITSYINEVIEKLHENKTFNGIENYIEYFYNDTVSLLDYIPKNTIIYYDEPQKIKEHTDTLFAEYSESIKNRIEKGYLLPKQTMIFDYMDILRMANNFSQVLFTVISQNIKGFNLKEIISFNTKSTSSFGKKFEIFCEDLKYFKSQNYRILILTGAKIRCERMVKELLDNNIESAYLPSLEENCLVDGNIAISSGKLSGGFQYDKIKLAVFSEGDIFSDTQKRRMRKRKKNGISIESFTDLKLGDYVVHESHGIGVYKGIEKIIVEGISKDYLKISYLDGGNLFVPVNQMDMIQKYIGSGGAAPKLNKLGGQDWIKAKAKVRVAVEGLAENLVGIYAKRQAAEGFVYSKDTSWQKEFEETFPYEETDDQLSAIEDVKRDMESKKVMDRLICGDVGYGKTEVAIRAAFKAVQDGKQVAYLVPTTILAQQHFNTFTQRMNNYPIRVELLSRFRTQKQQRETLKNLENGICDIVIGTHRILSKDVKFKNLGMVIVDEEQRFGVAHKEKLKALKENLDVLTLTATPIPRTLHMSLSGIRDMSILEEPPEERHPIQTYVLESNPEFIKEAINREINRNGQVYYLYNRIDNISEIAFRVQKLVPKAKVAYAHGRMTERELESIMEEFIANNIDVLVCTTIVETGLDIPNVNTIIIQDADKMGLSQLYQLRGRVGRSNRIAYAYLMYKKDKVLQEVAEKRLQTIREFTEFGSGFKIAMRDLEIRGAGNLLGAEQHGHMETVGYDMYCKLLDEAITKLKGEEPKENFETSVDLNINAYIPDFYVKNEEQRLELYKKISSITNIDFYNDVEEEIEDRYGNLPKSVKALLDIVLLKNYAHNFGIISIIQKKNNIIITFKSDANVDTVSLMKTIKNSKGTYLFTSAQNPYITIKTNQKDKLNSIAYVKNLLQDIKCFEDS